LFKFQNRFFPFPFGGMANFFQNSKTKKINSKFKNDFFHFKFYGINENFLSTRGCQSY
jgi:hypothetical protein